MEKEVQGDPLLFTCSQQSPKDADGWEGANLQGKKPEELQGGEPHRQGVTHFSSELT